MTYDSSSFGGASFGIRRGGTGATINANLGARGGYGGQIVPSCLGSDEYETEASTIKFSSRPISVAIIND